MSTTSLVYAGFVLGVLVIYYVLPRRWQNLWLLAASYAFVFSWAWSFAAVLAAVTLGNYALARWLGQARRGRAALLAAGLGLNVLLLLHFRYAEFYVPQLEALVTRLGLRVSTLALQVVLPLGLSFYALQAIAYLVEVYRRQLPPVTNLVDFSLYLAYFPKLVAGPIERARVFLPKLAAERIVDNEALARGGTLIVIGLVRKIVLADALAALIPAAAFNAPGQFSAPELAAYLLAYAFSLYNDFAGYTNIARGVSGLFGIELSPNFQQPYFARNFAEFWNRWHISLSHWLRDYIYFPLSRALLRRFPDRQHLVNLVLPPLATMLLSALWHASWAHKTILLWGLLHGLYQVGERLAWRGRPLTAPDTWPRRQQAVGMAITFALTALAWVPFHEGAGLSATFAYWRGLVDLSGWILPDWRIFLVIIPALALDWMQARHRDEVVFLRWPLAARSALLVLAFLLIHFNLRHAGLPFVYQGF